MICPVWSWRVLPPQDEAEDDVDWGEDISDAAIKARMEEISGAAKAMTLSDDIEKTSSERVNIFFEYVKVRPVFVVHNSRRLSLVLAVLVI